VYVDTYTIYTTYIYMYIIIISSVSHRCISSSSRDLPCTTLVVLYGAGGSGNEIQIRTRLRLRLKPIYDLFESHTHTHTHTHTYIWDQSDQYTMIGWHIYIYTLVKCECRANTVAAPFTCSSTLPPTPQPMTWAVYMYTVPHLSVFSPYWHTALLIHIRVDHRRYTTWYYYAHVSITVPIVTVKMMMQVILCSRNRVTAALNFHDMWTRGEFTDLRWVWFYTLTGVSGRRWSLVVAIG